MQCLYRVLSTIGLVVCLSLPQAIFGVEKKQDPIPPIQPDCRVIESSAAIIKRAVGEQFFARYLQFSVAQLRDTRGAEVVSTGKSRADVAEYDARPEVYYSLDWEIRFSGTRSVVRFDMDTAGRLLSDPATLRLPNCVERPEACTFSITATKAEEIGSRASGGKGDSKAVGFRWAEDFRRYVWIVQSWPQGGHSQLAIVDPSSGEVLLAGPWQEQGHGWK